MICKTTIGRLFRLCFGNLLPLTSAYKLFIEVNLNGFKNNLELTEHILT